VYRLVAAFHDFWEYCRAVGRIAEVLIMLQLTSLLMPLPEARTREKTVEMLRARSIQFVSLNL
jgi:hypothetical protein